MSAMAKGIIDGVVQGRKISNLSYYIAGACVRRHKGSLPRQNVFLLDVSEIARQRAWKPRPEERDSGVMGTY